MNQKCIIETLYGSFDNVHPLIFELLQSDAMKRIQLVQQYGVSYRVRVLPSYTRYDHCVGVWGLLYRYNASLYEQVAGLLHDVSHTAFSHIGDYIFKRSSDFKSYQDDIHEWYLNQTDVPSILKRYGLSCSEILPTHTNFPALEQDLPNLCADRLEYNLRGGLVAGLLTKQEIENILSDLRLDNGHWYFQSIEAAQRLALVSLHLTEHEWGSPSNHILYSLFAQVLRYALEIDLISSHELHFSTDESIWHKLETSKNTTLLNLMTCVKNHQKSYEFVPIHESNYSVQGKFRGLNPLIRHTFELKHLTEVDIHYKTTFMRSRARLIEGFPVKLSSWAQEACSLHKSLIS